MILSNCAFCSSVRSALMASVCLARDRRHLRARIGVAAARRFHQRRRSPRRRLHGSNRPWRGSRRRPCIESLRIAIGSRPPRPPPPPPPCACANASSRPRTSRPPSSPSGSSSSLLLPPRELWRYRRARIRPRACGTYHATGLRHQLRVRQDPRNDNLCERQRVSCRPLAQTTQNCYPYRPKRRTILVPSDELGRVLQARTERPQ